MKHLFFATITVLLTSAVGIVALEYAARWLMPQFDPSGHVRFEVDRAEGVVLGPRNRTFRQIKNTGDFDVSVSFNRWGLRDTKDFTDAKPEDLFFVGDSHAFGWGVEETERTSNQLERLLGRPVYNLGIPVDVPGYRALLAYARRHGAPVRRVILLVTSESDIANYSGAARSIEAGLHPIRDAFREVKGYLTSHSALYFLATAAVHATPALEQLALTTGLVSPVHEGAWFRAYDPAAVTSTVGQIEEITRQFETTVVVAPSRGLWVGRRQQDEELIHADLMRQLTARGFDVLDLRPAMEEGGHPMRYLFVNDGHWNSAGNALAARAIARHLAAQLPPR